jgi:diguanylate cyclase (GGDEF)-like protein
MPVPAIAFGSRVARRTFALFALSAALPLLGGGWLAYTAVARELEERAHARVADWAKNYGLEVFDRLIRADELLLKASPEASSEYRRLAASTYSSVVVAPPERGDVVLIGTPPPTSASRRAEAALGVAGRDATLVVDPSRRTFTVIRRLADGSVAHGELRSDFLWGDVDQLPGDILFCAVTLDARVLFCPDPSLARADGATVVRGRSGELLAAQWDLFLRSRFGVADVRIVAAEPARTAFAALASFERIFPQTLALALALALFAGLVQIRRSHLPLQMLVDAMDALSRGHFDRRVELDTQDEYSRLAAAVNTTAGALGRQFRALTVLSEIDRKILHAEAAEPVIESALPAVPELADCEAAAAVLAGEPGGRAVRLYGLADRGAEIDRLELAPGELEGFETLAGRWVMLDRAAGVLAPRLAGEFAAMALLPLRADSRVLGALVLLSRTARYGEIDAAASHAAELANRLSVALTNVRDKHQLVRQAYMDALTGLPNRELLRDRIGQELARSQRDGGRVALLFIDLDRFKNVNDSFGHSAGDALLRLAADRIRDRVRKTDTVARLGGDEFTVLVPGVHGPAHARGVAEQVLSAFAQPFALEGGDYFCSASLGIAISPDDGDGPEELLRNADTAMYRAKSSGRGTIAFFEDSMNRDARRRLELEQRLRTALENGEIHVHFQPKIDLRTGRVVGAEALARWLSPAEGEVPPSVFVPIAEDTGLIVQLGRRVLEDSCRNVAEWRASGHAAAHVAVNLSLRQLRQPDFPDIVGRLLAEHALPPGALELEVTESTLAEQPLEVTRILHELRRLGVRIAIDDFGTGYSSLASLRQLPIDVLKIDRLFVRDVPGGTHAEAIAGAIIAMGHMLGKEIVAEGVEHAAQADFLRQRGCEMAQGYHFGRAMPGHEFAAAARTPPVAIAEARRA